MGYKVGYQIPIERLKEFEKELEFMKGMVKTLIPKRQELINYSSTSDYEQKQIARKWNPEDYYKFRLWDVGCEIILTCYRYDAIAEKFCRSKEYSYSIRYYNCKSELFNDKKFNLKYCHENTSYGCFEKLEEAIPYFMIAVIDILKQKKLFKESIFNIVEELRNEITNS